MIKLGADGVRVFEPEDLLKEGIFDLVMLEQMDTEQLYKITNGDVDMYTMEKIKEIYGTVDVKFELSEAKEMWSKHKKNL